MGNGCCSDSDDMTSILVGLAVAMAIAMAFFIICVPPPAKRVAIYHCS